jgi:hypothetical protein
LYSVEKLFRFSKLLPIEILTKIVREGAFMSASLITKTALTGLLALAVSGCATGDLFGPTHPGPTTPEDDIAAYASQKNGSAEALDDLGWSPSRRLSSDEEEILARREKLKELENHMSDMREREQYFKYKSFLDNDDERIRFLSLDGTEARDRYAMQKGIYFHANRFPPAVRDAVSRSDIILGMGKEAVVESWGEPATVEVAGQEVFGNERWAYVDYVETPEGYQRQERIVIFEAGKVAGWQRQ